MEQARKTHITPFNFEHHNVRVVVENNEPWFIGKDVCAALGLSNHKQALTRLNPDEKKGVIISDPLGKNRQNATGVNEPGIYRLVFTSRVEAAERFKRWLAHEVLPAIRKTGSYIAEKPIAVRKHNRRTSTKIDDALRLKQNVDRLERVAASLQPPETKPQNVCAMIIDGEPIWVDINKFDGDGRAVVIEHDGRICIQNVEQERSGFKPLGIRSALGERYPSSRGSICRNTVAVIGMVLEGGGNKSSIPDHGKTIDHEAIRKPKAPYRDRIITLLGTGLSKRQIAERVGCSVHGVDYWQRRVNIT